jgi:hypothetical protein
MKTLYRIEYSAKHISEAGTSFVLTGNARGEDESRRC